MSEQLEITVSWDGNPLHSTLHSGGPIAIGPNSECWFSLPESVLASNHELIVPQGEGGWILSIPEGAEARIAKDGVAVASDERLVSLTDGTSAEVRIGDFSFFVRPTAKVVSTVPKTARRYRWMRWMAVAAAFHLIVLGMFAMSPPDVAALNAADLQETARYIPVRLDPPAPLPEEPVQITAAGDNGGDTGAPAGEPGGDHSTDPSEAGSPAPVRQHARHNPRPAFVPSAETVSNLGTIAVLNNMMPSFGDDTSPFDAANATDGPGGVMHASILSLPGGPRWGALDMTGSFHGTCNPRVQDCTADMIETGSLTTHGEPGSRRVPDLGPRRNPPHGPTIHPQPPHTVGSLSRSQIRLTVRRHINEVRFCYEQGLQSRPDLEGRVAVSFIISPSGAVQSSVVANSTVNNSRVEGCVSQAVSRWTFPSAAGVTGVTYPFLLQTN